jgi:uncharacterized protein
VVGEDALDQAEILYEFFAHIGCRSLGINFADVLNFNSTLEQFSEERVRSFWRGLYRAWRANPVIAIREFTHALSWVRAVLDEIDAEMTKLSVDLFPTIDSKGNLAFLSPEFVNSKSTKYEDFLAGNVLKENFLDILDSFGEITYVSDFFSGRAACRDNCRYFGSCGGGNAANKYFEHGTTNATETNSCRRQEMLMIDTVLSS